MRWFGIFLAGVVAVSGAGVWIHSGMQDAQAAVTRFCVTLHAGEPWAPAVQRAAERELRFEKVSPRSARIEEYRAERDAFGERYACTVQVEEGHVVGSGVAELPRE